MSTNDVVARLSVKDKAAFSRDMQGAQGDVEGIGSAGERGGSRAGAAMGALKIGVAAVATAAVAVGTALFKVGTEFDSAYDTIRVGTGATGAALAELQDDFRAVAASVPAEFGDISTAIADLNTRLGLTGEPLQELSAQFLNLSRITGTDVATNVADMTRLFGDWGVEGDAMTGTMDAIFRAAQATGIEIGQLSNQMVTYGAPMRQLGFTFEEGAALLANFERQGVNAELVMGSMRQALGRMAREGEPAVETFRRVTDAIAAAGSTSEGNAMALELFGARAGPDMAAAIREGRFEVTALMDKIANGSETIAGAAEDTADFSEKWQVFKNRIMLAVEPAASALFSAIGRGMDWVQQQMPVVIAAVRPFFDGMVEAWPQIQDAIVTAWGYIQPVLQFLGDTLAWVWRNIWVPAFDFIANIMWPGIVAAVTVAWPIIRDFWVMMRDIIVNIWDNVLTPAWQFWVDVLWPGLKRAMSEAWTGMAGVFSTIRTVVQTVADKWVSFRDTVVSVWTRIRTAASTAWDFIKRNVIDPMTRALGSVGNALAFLPGVGGGTETETAASSMGLPSPTRSVSFAVPRAVVTPVRGQMASGAGAPVNVSFHVSAVDVDSFRGLVARERRMIAEEVAVAVGRARVTA